MCCQIHFFESHNSQFDGKQRVLSHFVSHNVCSPSALSPFVTEVIDFPVLHADHATSILETQITLSQKFPYLLYGISKRFRNVNPAFSLASLLLGEHGIYDKPHQRVNYHYDISRLPRKTAPKPYFEQKLNFLTKNEFSAT